MTHARHSGTPSFSNTPPASDFPARTLETPVEEIASALPHDCVPQTLPQPATESGSGQRMAGIDVARALALVGMIAVHLLSDSTAEGNLSPAFLLASGKSAALFAVLAGVGIAFTTGRTRRPTGRRWLGSMAEIAVRGLLIGALGLAIGPLVSVESAAIILPFYGVLFLLAIPFLRFSPAVLGILAVGIAVAMPVLSHDLRQSLPVVAEINPTFGMLFADPQATLQLLLLTGIFPALPWLAYVLAGLAVGRMHLTSRAVMFRLTTMGIGLMIVADTVTWFLMERLGGFSALTEAAEQIMSRDSYIDLLVWGAGGTLPTNSPWWLGVLAPHTSTPADLLFTMGLALAVIGAALALALVAPNAFQPLARLGRMPLSVYTAHLLLLTVLPWDGALGFLTHLLLLGVLVMVWGRFFRRGPLEQLIWWIADGVDRAVGGRPARRSIPSASTTGGR